MQMNLQLFKTYWYPYWDFDSNEILVRSDRWFDTTQDYALKALGLVYEDKQTCEEHKLEDYKRLTGREWGNG